MAVSHTHTHPPPPNPPNKKIQTATILSIGHRGLFEISQPFLIKIPRIKKLGDELEKDEESMSMGTMYYEFCEFIDGCTIFTDSNKGCSKYVT